MAARTCDFTTITADEFRDFITGLVPDAERADLPGTSEEAWRLPLPADDRCIMVFSTVQGGSSRGYGEDAIRCVIWAEDKGCPVGGERKTLRIGPSESNPDGWRGNLEPKIRELYRSWRQYDHGGCPACGDGVLVERRPSGPQDWDPFLACSEWDGGRGCEHAEDL